MLLWKNKWVRLACFGLVFTAYAVTMSLLLGTACLSKLLFGLPCPGCGLTRGNLAALRLDFKAAFEMHPLWFYSVIGAGLLVAVTAKPEIIKKKWFSYLCVALAVILVAVFAVRMFIVAPAVPLDAYDDSLLHLLVEFFKKLFS